MLREILLTLLVTVVAGSDGLDEARQLLQNGRYAEAQEAYEAILNGNDLPAPVRAKAVLGQADCLASQGEVERAVAALTDLAAQQPQNADLAARVADLQLARGDWEAAASAARRARKVDPDHIAARWVEARLLEARGELDPAVDAWKWFIDRYNEHQADLAKDAEALLIVGQASERYYRAMARGDELSESLNDVINEIYEGALKADPQCWQAPWLEGRLFLSGYNEAAAAKELARAMKINPQAAEVLVTLGNADLQGYKLAAGRAKVERALAINPRYAPAHILLADLNISDERFTDALAAAQKAVAENRHDQDALARLAASFRLLVDPVGAAVAEALALGDNPRPATFYAALGERLADRRKYHSAERAFLLAAAADPRRAEAPIGLGMLYMQIGRENEARDLFQAAFAADPFNVRANNQMLVLKHMASYKPILTEHYSVLVDPKQDELLGKYMGRYLESIHGELTTRFGYSPPEMTQIEILKDHKWFSGRTIGLPFIPTVGACTGKVVALASPRATGKPFNWARVLKHELVHVITLQQTDFNIPHWYTEALAVESEGFPRPQEWNKLLLERVPSRSKLLNLDTINLGFIRPKEPDDRQMAYCQAQLYAQYMLKRFGSDALIKMLGAYRRGLTTDRAIAACFHVEKADFEAEYLTSLDEVVKTIRTRVNDEKPIKFSQLERMLKEKPDDADLNARMAYEHFARRDLKEARPFAEKALKAVPHQPLASYVKARLLVTIGDEESALAVLEPALDPNKPNERVIDLLAELQLKAGKLDEAERLYELARRDDPVHTKWIAGLARVHLRQKNDAKFLTDLAMIADNDADDLDVRKALAERHLAAKQPDLAEKWAMECLYVNVYDPACHLFLADALAAQKKYAPAIEEYQTAIELKAKRPNDLKVKLAKAQLGLGNRDAAKATLDTLLKDDPDHPEAKELRKEISD
ncbi:Tetratricopeptide repeat-containing protein [Singulisphaera sp. GP187]|uniref:tetratricopeptide repeat protein n=1 Tax=Singulisphaera sp. GP187 TaxID=1882752 RepID=UPI0009260CB7|nr:tetratricopeptide repeat protein [Singulisphaera sp. GP187]SIO43087.1 Tetratricopeptide repeat-containing protein [Singulisphaera sp. GP187]